MMTLSRDSIHKNEHISYILIWILVFSSLIRNLGVIVNTHGKINLVFMRNMKFLIHDQSIPNKMSFH